MRKTIVVLSACASILAFVACGGDNTNKNNMQDPEDMGSPMPADTGVRDSGTIDYHESNPPVPSNTAPPSS